MKEALEKIFNLSYKAKVSSCTCGTRTEFSEYHDETCHYRQIADIFKIAQLALGKEVHE